MVSRLLLQAVFASLVLHLALLQLARQPDRWASSDSGNATQFARPYLHAAIEPNPRCSEGTCSPQGDKKVVYRFRSGGALAQQPKPALPLALPALPSSDPGELASGLTVEDLIRLRLRFAELCVYWRENLEASFIQLGANGKLLVAFDEGGEASLRVINNAQSVGVRHAIPELLRRMRTVLESKKITFPGRLTVEITNFED